MKFCKRLPVLILAAAMPSLLLACGGEEGDNMGGVDSGPAVCTPEGDHTYVVNKVDVPLSAAEASSLYGFDLDADDTPDNKVGRVLATLTNDLNVDVPTAVDKAINEGTAILLLNVQASDLANASCAGATVYLGADADPTPCENEQDTVCGRHLSGSASFGISESSPMDATVVGRIISGHFEGGPDLADSAGEDIVVELPVIEGAPPLRLSLVGARIDIMQVSEDGLMDGRLGGAVPLKDVQESVLPTLHMLIEGIIAEDCTGTPETMCCADENSQGAEILTLFDANSDCQVPQEELEESAVIQLLLDPDVDLLDASGNYAPGADQVDDSLSLGLGFTATTATFTAP